MFCLGSKEGCSFYSSSLHILDQLVRLKCPLPVVFMLQSLVIDKFSVVLQLYNLFKHPMSAKVAKYLSKFLKFKILTNLE